MSELKSLLQFIFEPLKKFKTVIESIDNRLKFYSNVITNSGLPEEKIKECSDCLRNLSCELEASYKQIPFRLVFLIARIIPSKTEVSEATRILGKLSIYGGKQGYETQNYEDINIIRKKLRIEQL